MGEVSALANIANLKTVFFKVSFSPLFVFSSISLERPVAAFAASKERACENLRNY